MNDFDERPSTFRKRAQELLDLAGTMSAPARDELLRVALMWRRLADEAEAESSATEPQE